ncbi:MAG: rRNA pseudouridine synthase [Clostridium sp.]|nr:rRNA pseudouridine synthase [Clostridium sp.]
MRLDRFLCEVGIGSRKEVKEIIRNGSVTVNGELAKQADMKIREDTDQVVCLGKTCLYQQFSYFILHKPSGVVTATKDDRDKTVMDCFTEAFGLMFPDRSVPTNLAPVGRLDKDTEGLLLITNDGLLAHRLLSPAKHVDKTYYVRAMGQLSVEDIEPLCSGVDIGDETPTLPAKAEILCSNKDETELHLTIHEGRFHQIKRMLVAVGSQVIYLKRVQFGSLKLDDTLPVGAIREINVRLDNEKYFG